MISTELKEQYYQALVAKDSEYEGLFYVGVKTTGVFCRPTCPARKPKYENCEFYETAQQALLASFRPCQRCRPLSHPNQVSDVVRILVEAVENNPEKRWKGQDFRICPSMSPRHAASSKAVRHDLCGVCSRTSHGTGFEEYPLRPHHYRCPAIDRLRIQQRLPGCFLPNYGCRSYSCG